MKNSDDIDNTPDYYPLAYPRVYYGYVGMHLLA